MIRHIWGLFTRPHKQWASLREERLGTGKAFAHLMILAVIPVVCAYIGTTEVGWRIGNGPAVKITGDSALRIGVLYYVTLIVGVSWVAWMIGWMANTYGAKQPFSQCLVLATYIATPFFLFGLMQLYPVLWINLVAGFPALAFTVVLLYTGVPEMMQIPEEKGFLFSSSVLAIGLVLLVSVLAATVMIWSFGLAPAYTE